MKLELFGVRTLPTLNTIKNYKSLIITYLVEFVINYIRDRKCKEISSWMREFFCPAFVLIEDVNQRILPKETSRTINPGQLMKSGHKSDCSKNANNFPN